MQEDSILVPLTRGKFAIIDADDAERILAHKWLCINPGYAARMTGPAKKRRLVLMHREIIGASAGLDVDHINGDPLDNRKRNLREATRSQNNYNARLSRTNTSGFRGVVWFKPAKKWRANIGANGQNHYLGLFENLEDAVRARDEAAERLHGEFARLSGDGGVS